MQRETIHQAWASVDLGEEWDEDFELEGPSKICAELGTAGSFPPNITIKARGSNVNCANVLEWRVPAGWLYTGNNTSSITIYSYPTNTPPYYPKNYTIRAKSTSGWKSKVVRFEDCWGNNEPTNPCDDFTFTSRISSKNQTELTVLFIGDTPKFTVFSVAGETVLDGIISKNPVDISLLNNGQYIFSIENENFKFIKN